MDEMGEEIGVRNLEGFKGRRLDGYQHRLNGLGGGPRIWC